MTDETHPPEQPDAPAGPDGPGAPEDLLTPLADPLADLDADPALASAVLEIETHVAGEGWDGPARLYALVDTARIVADEPVLAAQMGLDDASEQGSLTAVEQEQLPPDQQLEEALATILWPDSVDGCVAVVERLVLPPDVDGDIPEDPEAARAFAADHPDRQEVRIVAGVRRSGATYCALRLRAHDDAASVVGGIDLVPELLELIATTLADEATDDSSTHLSPGETPDHTRHEDTP